jgi:ABC-type lipoprotein export system ATPase subunit
MLLQTRHLTKRYARPSGEVIALADVHLTLSAGEFVAVQGASGSGKTTLLLVVAGLLRPDAGKVWLDGQDLYRLPSSKRAELRARRVGMVFQQFHLIPYLTVLGNVRLPQLAGPVAGGEQRAHELIDQFGLSDRIDHVPADLSTGERQRVALARALLHRPALLLADEPTGNLDTDNSAAVLRALRAFAEQGGAVLLVTHNPDAAAVADRVGRMNAGRLSFGAT